MLPWLTGIVPFGLVIGVSAARADIPTLAGWLTGPLLFGGARRSPSSTCSTPAPRPPS